MKSRNCGAQLNAALRPPFGGFNRGNLCIALT